MFTKAEKSKSKLRLALFGISGSGKTYSALAIASGMSKKIALIDTERSSASLYADRFDFDTADLEQPVIENYTQYITNAAEAGYEVLIIDSMTHGWRQLVMEVDKIAETRYKGNTWSAWSKGTPKQNAFIDALLSFPGHIIATMRSRTEYTVSNENGKVKPVRVGLSPDQGKNIEYEFSLLMEMSPEHNGLVLKDRTGKFQDKIIEKPGPAFGKELIEWLNDGKEAVSVKERIEAWIEAETSGDKTAKKELIQSLTNKTYESLDGIKPAHLTRLFQKCQKEIEAYERRAA